MYTTFALFDCPHCGGRMLNGDPEQGIRFRGSGECLDCVESAPVVHLNSVGTYTHKHERNMSMKSAFANRMDLSRAGHVACPMCNSNNVNRSPGKSYSGPVDRCGNCSHSWPAKSGTLTDEQHAAKASMAPDDAGETMLSRFARSL